MMKFYQEHGCKFGYEKDDFESPEAYKAFVKNTMEAYRASLEADYLQDGSEDSYEDMKGEDKGGKYVRIGKREIDGESGTESEENDEEHGEGDDGAMEEDDEEGSILMDDYEENLEEERESGTNEEQEVLMEDDGKEDNEEDDDENVDQSDGEENGEEIHEEMDSENINEVKKNQEDSNTQECGTENASQDKNKEDLAEKDSKDAKTEKSKDGIVTQTGSERSRRSMKQTEKSLSLKTPGKNYQSVTKKVLTKTSLETKPDPDTCLGIRTSQTDLDKIRLNKEYLLARINTIEKFLDTKISNKELKEALVKEDKLGEQLAQKTQLGRSSDSHKSAVKRKRPMEDGQSELVVKKAVGRPFGWRKPKQEPESPTKDSPKTNFPHKPPVKRSKKDQLLLLKALDEEMLKMDEESNKEMERISQGLDYQCSVCSQVFIEKKNLSKHFFKCLMKFTQSGRSSFKCAICFEYFSLLENLEIHIERKHGNVCDDPFQCSQCSLCFSQSSDLKGHILEKHDVFQCEHCEKYYRSQRMLDVHVSKKHPGARSKKDGRFKRETRRNSATEKTSQETIQQSRQRTDISISDVKIKQEPDTEQNLQLATTSVNSKTKNAPISDAEVKTEIPSEPERAKKLGRPFKRKTIDGDSPKTADVQNAPKPNGSTEPQAKTEDKNDSGRKASSSASEEVSSEEAELGRGRRVKKKKTLDYDDLSLTGRSTRRSIEPTSTFQNEIKNPTNQNDTKNIPFQNDVKKVDPEVKLEAKVPSPTAVHVKVPTPPKITDSNSIDKPTDSKSAENPVQNPEDQKFDNVSVQNDVKPEPPSDSSKDSNALDTISCPSELLETHLSPQNTPEKSLTPSETTTPSNSEFATPEKSDVDSSTDVTGQSAESSPAANVHRKVLCIYFACYFFSFFFKFSLCV